MYTQSTYNCGKKCDVLDRLSEAWETNTERLLYSLQGIVGMNRISFFVSILLGFYYLKNFFSTIGTIGIGTVYTICLRQFLLILVRIDYVYLVNVMNIGSKNIISIFLKNSGSKILVVNHEKNPYIYLFVISSTNTLQEFSYYCHRMDDSFH